MMNREAHNTNNHYKKICFPPRKGINSLIYSSMMRTFKKIINHKRWGKYPPQVKKLNNVRFLKSSKAKLIKLLS